MTDKENTNDTVFTMQRIISMDIDSFRQNLIYDLEDHYWDTLDKDKDLIIKHMTNIINRRFGDVNR